MRFQFAIISLLLLILLSGFKPPQKQQLPLLDKPLKSPNSLLWQISGNGLSKPSYLFGTIHMIAQNDYFLGKNVQNKIQKSDLLVMEVDLNNIDIAALTRLSLLDSGKTIRNYMNDTDYNLLQIFMEDSVGIKKFTFENFYAKLKPFYIEQLIFFRYLGQEKESYEQNFNKIAESQNIPIQGLETLEEQLRFIDQSPLESQLKDIVKTIGNYHAEVQKLDQLVKKYQAQDLTALTKAFEEEKDTAFIEKLVNNRNHNWVPKLKSFISDKSCFIAVGAGHLGGKNGLIQLLKEQGYTVEPVSIN